MPAQARVTDKIVIHCPHSGTGKITTGSSYSFVDGLAVARVSDKAVCDKCGVEFKITSGSSYSFADGLQKARVGDALKALGPCSPGECKQCPHAPPDATIVTGSPYTFVG